MSEAYNSFLAYGRSERNYARETLTKHKDCFQSWILPYLGQKLVSEINRADIFTFRDAMVKKGIGINRQYSVLMTLKVFLKFCRSVLNTDSLDHAEIRLPVRPRPHVQYLTNEEIQRVLSVIPVHTITGLRLRTLIILLLNTGLRISEALGLDRTPFELVRFERESSRSRSRNSSCPVWDDG